MAEMGPVLWEVWRPLAFLWLCRQAVGRGVIEVIVVIMIAHYWHFCY